MCYNLGLSIASTTVIWAVSAYIARSEYTPQTRSVLVGTLIGLSTMQIAEALMHADDDCSDGLNKFGSRLAWMSLYVLQPIFSAAGMAAVPTESFAGVEFNKQGLPWYTSNAVKWAVWGVLYLAMIGMICNSDLIGGGTTTYMSTSLKRVVSRWCTVDKDNRSLYWRFDDDQPSGLWYVYYFVVLGFPALHIEGKYFGRFYASRVWFIAIPAVHIIMIYVTSFWTAAASCFFGPLIVGLALAALHPASPTSHHIPH